MIMSRLSSLSTIVAGLAMLAACTDQAPAPTGLGLSASRSGVPFAVGLASPVWQTTATYLFPSQAQSLANMVQAQADASPGGPHPAFARGAATGRAVGAEIVARAQNDGFSRPFTGTKIG